MLRVDGLAQRGAQPTQLGRHCEGEIAGLSHRVVRLAHERVVTVVGLRSRRRDLADLRGKGHELIVVGLQRGRSGHHRRRGGHWGLLGIGCVLVDRTD